MKKQIPSRSHPLPNALHWGMFRLQREFSFHSLPSITIFFRTSVSRRSILATEVAAVGRKAKEWSEKPRLRTQRHPQREEASSRSVTCRLGRFRSWHVQLSARNILPHRLLDLWVVCQHRFVARVGLVSISQLFLCANDVRSQFTDANIRVYYKDYVSKQGRLTPILANHDGSIFHLESEASSRETKWRQTSIGVHPWAHLRPMGTVLFWVINMDNYAFERLFTLSTGRRWMAWTCDAIDFFSVSLSVTNLEKQFDKTAHDITTAITLTLLFRSLGAVSVVTQLYRP
jgi:hypothetical protein